MIKDLSLTLKNLLRQELPGDVSIVFNRPTEQFNPSQTCINLFLYDLRENVELRSNDISVTRQDGQATLRSPPMRVACSYLITAWVPGQNDDDWLREHELLSQVLQSFARNPTLPTEVMPINSPLRQQVYPLPMVTAHADTLRNLGEFWTALGNHLRASVTLTVTIGIDTHPLEIVPLATHHSWRLEVASASTTAEDFAEISGQVTDSSIPPKPVVGATVRLLEAELSTQTRADGRYLFGLLSSGTYTLTVQLGASPPLSRQIVIPPMRERESLPQIPEYNVQLSVQLPN